MTAPPPGPFAPAPGTMPPAPPRPTTVSAADERGAAVRTVVRLVVALAVIGALLGLVWAAWAPRGPRGYVIRPGVIQPDETEAWAAGDARYAILAAVVGVLAALLAWTRRRERGTAVVVGLAVGGLAGALAQWGVGRLIGPGSDDGAANTIIGELPLTLHATALVVLEPALAVLVYGLFVAFTSRDDLGRPDPVRDQLTRPGPPPVQPAWAAPGSVGTGDDPQDGGGHRDAPGGLQQRDLPPQQP